MPTDHVVQQGDHLSSIAKQYGFPDYTTIWNYGDNADLKQQRGNPNVLLPGDTVVIPDKEEKQEAGETAKRHTFKVSGNTLMLRLQVEDAYEKPVGNATCDLYLDGAKTTVTTDGDGKIEKAIPADIKEAKLVLASEETPYQDEFLILGVGQLDPVDTLSGQAARLTNLGYFAGDPQAEDDPDFQSAAQEFQCDQKLQVDGVVGPQTQAKLKQVHGC